MIKKHKKICTVLDYIKHLLIFTSAVTLFINLLYLRLVSKIVKSNWTNKYKQNQIKVSQKPKLKYNYRHNLQMQVAGFHSLMCFLKSSILSRILKLFETTFNIRL